MKRRLNLALAVVHQPEIVVLDEPSEGLDPQSRRVIWRYIRSLRDDEGKNVILTTHIMDEADRLSNRVAISVVLTVILFVIGVVLFSRNRLRAEN